MSCPTIGPATAILAGPSAVLLIRFRLNVTWLVFGGGVAGLLEQAILY